MSIASVRIRFGMLAVAIAVALTVLLPLGAANANPDVQVAVFGDNEIDNYLTEATFDVDLVTMENLETPGFLDAYDVFVYTRDGTSFGSSLSPGAVANVQAFVGSNGRGVLLNGDFADTLLGAEPNTEVEELISNSVTWAAGGSGGGYVGEFNGAAAGLTMNSDDLAALGFIEGFAGLLGEGPAEGSIEPTAIGASSPVLAGVDLSADPDNLEYGSIFTGVADSHVLAVYDNPSGDNDGNPAILSFQTAEEVVVCEAGSECEIEGSGDDGASATTITAEGDGVLKANFGSDDNIDCTYPDERPFRGRDYEEISGFTTEFFFEGNGDIVVVGQVSRERMREIGIKSLLLQSCFAGPRPFKELNLTPAAQEGGEFIGLLPNCRFVASSEPCVERRRPLQGIIETRIPFEYHLGEDPKKRF